MKNPSKFISFIVITLLATSLYAQKNPILLEVAGEKITTQEFLRVYKKNNVEGAIADKKSIEEYLNLYIDFRLKVRHAKDLGLDTSQEFMAEFEQYRSQLAEPYLIDPEVEEHLLKEAWERMQYEIRASHILVKVGPHASPEDTLKAYNRVMDLYNRVIKGASFQSVAEEYSDDPNTRDRQQQGQTIPGNKGDLGYFSAFDMVYPFETAAYTLEEGEISRPIRTNFGYHIIKKDHKIPALGEIKIAHIMLSYQETDSLEAWNRLDSIRTQITQGDLTFEEAAAKFSFDRRTSNQGGELPGFQANQMFPSFIEAISKLDPAENPVSPPIHTPYGIHLIRIISTNPPGTFEEERALLAEKLKTSNRIKEVRKISAKSIREQYGLSLNQDVKEKILSRVSGKILTNQWEATPEEFYQEPLFTIGDKQYAAGDFARYLSNNQKRDGEGNPQSYANAQLDAFITECSFDYKMDRLEKNHPEFAHLLGEYRDGILLFNLKTDKIWNKAMEDTVGLRAFFLEHHKGEHMWDERLHAVIYRANSREAAAMARKMVREGTPAREIAENVNKMEELQLSVDQRKFEKGDHPLIDEEPWEKGLSGIRENKGAHVFVHRLETIDPEPKELKEVRGLIIARYQDHLEKQWVKKLRETYPYKINNRQLKKITP